MAPPNPIIRPLGPIVNAVRQFRQSLYSPPKTTIDNISENLWPNPLQPVTPMAPIGAQPLKYPFPWGQNLTFTPRYDSLYSAAYLRYLSTYIIARICIENNKDILCRMPWKVQLKPLPGETSKDRAKRGHGDEILLKLNRFFDRPNYSDDWPEFLRPILEDMLVIDAASIFIGRQQGTGKVSELRWVEGASITRLIDANGWTPKPPNVAYQQLWEGYPRVDLTTDQLVYRPRNIVYRGTATSAIYGMSPVEQIVKEIEIGIQRLQYIYDFYSEGTIPGGILFAPLNTPPEKIAEAQKFLDSEMAGQLARRRRLSIFQGFQADGKNEQYVFPKEPSLTDIFDELHIRKICFAFGTSPQRLMRQMNRASAVTVQESAEEEGTLPWLSWLKGTIDYVIQVVMGFKEYESAFDAFVELDKLKQAMADGEDIKMGLYTRNEKREERGDDPRPEPEADELNVLTAQGLVPLQYAPRVVPGGQGQATSSRTPKGGAQPRATATVNATSSLTTNKGANGSSKWIGCEYHKLTGPQSSCYYCVRSTMAAFERERQEEAIEVY